MDKSLFNLMEMAIGHPRYSWLTDFVNSSKDKLVLNPGSADGSPITNLFYKRGAKVISLDLNLADLKNNPTIKLQGNALYLPFKDNTFDFLTSEALILHTIYIQNRIEDFLNEAKRILKPGGHYIGHEIQVEFDDLIRARFVDVNKTNGQYVHARKSQ